MRGINDDLVTPDYDRDYEPEYDPPPNPEEDAWFDWIEHVAEIRELEGVD